MIFLNAMLLWGAAAVSIPVLVHLFNKHRYQVRRWGAMHLIEASIKIQKRRMRIENLLLMLVRCLIPLLLAMCLSRPVITGAGALWGNVETSLVLLMDDSYSLEYEGTGGKPFHKAREMAAQMVKDLKHNSDVQIVRLSGGKLYDGPRSNLNRVQKDLAEMEAGFGKAQMVPGFKEVAAMHQAGKLKNMRREVVVLTDFQRVSWPSNELAALQAEVTHLQKQKSEMDWTLIQVGAGEMENLSVESLDYPKLPLAPQQTLRVRATVRNYGSKDRRGLPVSFRVDGKIIPPDKQMDLGAGQQHKAPTEDDPFQHVFDQPGTHIIEVNVDQDSLKADNSHLASVEVWDNVPVLVIDGEPSAASLRGQTDFKGESDFLRIALQPFRELKIPGEKDLFNARIIKTADFDAATIGDARVLVMANVPRLDDAQTEALKQYVQQGGGLLIFLGDQVDKDWYNQNLSPGGYLPAPLKDLQDRTRDAVPFVRVAPQASRHPAMEIFTGDAGITARINKWFRLVEQPDNPPYTELARLEGGDFFLVERKVAEGRVVLCTTTCDEEWLQGILEPYYVPLMQQLVMYLASSVSPPRNLNLTQPITAWFPAADVGKEVSITYLRADQITEASVKLADNTGLVEKVKITAQGQRGHVFFGGTQRPGLYVLRDAEGRLQHYVVNVNREESDLQQLDEKERAQVATALGARLVKSVDEYKNLDNKRRFGQEIWKWLLWAVLAFTFVELILQQWMSRNKA